MLDQGLHISRRALEQHEHGLLWAEVRRGVRTEQDTGRCRVAVCTACGCCASWPAICFKDQALRGFWKNAQLCGRGQKCRTQGVLAAFTRNTLLHLLMTAGTLMHQRHCSVAHRAGLPAARLPGASGTRTRSQRLGALHTPPARARPYSTCSLSRVRGAARRLRHGWNMQDGSSRGSRCTAGRS